MRLTVATLVAILTSCEASDVDIGADQSTHVECVNGSCAIYVPVVTKECIGQACSLNNSCIDVTDRCPTSCVEVDSASLCRGECEWCEATGLCIYAGDTEQTRCPGFDCIDADYNTPPESLQIIGTGLRQHIAMQSFTVVNDGNLGYLNLTAALFVSNQPACDEVQVFVDVVRMKASDKYGLVPAVTVEEGENMMSVHVASKDRIGYRHILRYGDLPTSWYDDSPIFVDFTADPDTALVANRVYAIVLSSDGAQDSDCVAVWKGTESGADGYTLGSYYTYFWGQFWRFDDANHDQLFEIVVEPANAVCQTTQD